MPPEFRLPLHFPALFLADSLGPWPRLALCSWQVHLTSRSSIGVTLFLKILLCHPACLSMVTLASLLLPLKADSDFLSPVPDPISIFLILPWMKREERCPARQALYFPYPGCGSGGEKAGLGALWLRCLECWGHDTIHFCWMNANEDPYLHIFSLIFSRHFPVQDFICPSWPRVNKWWDHKIRREMKQK